MLIVHLRPITSQSLVVRPGTSLNSYVQYLSPNVARDDRESWPLHTSYAGPIAGSFMAVRQMYWWSLPEIIGYLSHLAL